MKATLLTVVIVHLLAAAVVGQEKDKLDKYGQLEKKYNELKDSSTALHPFVPAVSSTILEHQQLEVNLFNALISANKYRDEEQDVQELSFRQSYSYNTLQLTYGVSKSRRFNVGIDLNSAAGRVDQDRNSSAFKVFDATVTGNSRHAWAITSFSPRIRWRPLKKNYNFTIQNSVVIPFNINAEKQTVLGRGQYYWSNQFLYNQPLSKHLFLFSQLGFNYAFKRDALPSTFSIPATLYVSYFVPRRVILFALYNYVPMFSNQTGANNYRFTMQLGGGVQYQLSKQVLLNGYYVTDVAGKNYPDFDTYNLSVRFTTR